MTETHAIHKPSTGRCLFLCY